MSRDNEVQQICWSAGVSQEQAHTVGCPYVGHMECGLDSTAAGGDKWKAIATTMKTGSPRKAGISWQFRYCLLLQLFVAEGLSTARIVGMLGTVTARIVSMLGTVYC